MPPNTDPTPPRCAWCGGDSLYVQYHDEEWGVPVHDDRRLFEMLILEGAQAGLSWITVLRKRDNYRAALDNFDPGIVAGYGRRKVNTLMHNAGIIRNKSKLESTVTNAKAFLDIQAKHGSFDVYLWNFVNGEPIVNRFRSMKQVPASTPLSDRVSKDLRSRGFKFVGSTICYAYLQAVGLVNDHVTTCFRHPDYE